MKIKIVYVITGLGTGGAEMMLYKLLSRLDLDKFLPTVVSLVDRGTFGKRIEALGIDVLTINMKPGVFSIAALWRLKNLLINLQPDLIQGWMYHGGLMAQLATTLSLRKFPVCWSIHHSVNSLAAEKKSLAAVIKFCALTSKYVDRVIYCSKKSQLQHHALGYCFQNSHLIFNSVDTLCFQPSTTAKDEIYKELNLSENSILIGLIARYHPMKDHANFLQAAAIITQEYPEIHFILAGSNVDYNNSSLSELINSLKINDRTHLLGLRDDAPNLIASLDILTVSSAFGEAFPTVIGEAMACEVVCTTTDVGDAAEIVGETGIVVPPKDALALANAWKKILSLSVEERQTIGKKARQRILNKFSLYSDNSFANQYENLYKNILFKNN